MDTTTAVRPLPTPGLGAGKTVASAFSDADFKGFCRLVQELAGIQMGSAKKPFVAAWMARRLVHHGLDNHGDYLALIEGDAIEQQIALDLFTTQETYFFREPRHFSFVAEHIAPALRHQGAVRAWSAGCATGEEPCTLAMVLMHALGHGRFEVLASDIATGALQHARTGLYPMPAARDIPWDYRSSYCIKGQGGQEGGFMMDSPIRDRLLFEQINLNAELPDVGLFDVIFLRNVLVYFPQELRRTVLARMLRHLKPGGWFVVSHAESLQGLTDALRPQRPSIYQRPGP